MAQKAKACCISLAARLLAVNKTMRASKSHAPQSALGLHVILEQILAGLEKYSAKTQWTSWGGGGIVLTNLPLLMTDCFNEMVLDWPKTHV